MSSTIWFFVKLVENHHILFDKYRKYDNVYVLLSYISTNNVTDLLITDPI